MKQMVVFLDSCDHHCGQWNAIVIDGMRSGVAFRDWYGGQKGQHFQGKTILVLLVAMVD